MRGKLEGFGLIYQTSVLKQVRSDKMSLNMFGVSGCVTHVPSLGL